MQCLIGRTRNEDCEMTQHYKRINPNNTSIKGAFCTRHNQWGYVHSKVTEVTFDDGEVVRLD